MQTEKLNSSYLDYSLALSFFMKVSIHKGMTIDLNSHLPLI